MSLLEAQLEARNLLQQCPLFLHSKTTGAMDLSEVIEIAILDSSGKPLVDELVKPKRHIRPTATDEHGVTDEMVDTAPRWAEILPKVEEVLVGNPAAGHPGCRRTTHRSCRARRHRAATGRR